MDFAKFIKLMKKIAYERFKTNDCLEKLAPLLKIPAKRRDFIDENIQKWINQANSIEIKKLMSENEEILRLVYSIYCSKEILNQNKMGLNNMLEFCIDIDIVTGLSSNLDLVRIFRYIENCDGLNFEQFVCALACISIFGMGNIGIHDHFVAIGNVLKSISAYSEFFNKKKYKNSRWKIQN